MGPLKKKVGLIPFFITGSEPMETNKVYRWIWSMPSASTRKDTDTAGCWGA